MPIKTEEIKQDDIAEYKQNSLINRVRVSQADEVIKAPKGTLPSLKKGGEIDLLRRGYVDKEMKSRTRRFIIKNNYCTINLDTYFNGRLAGDFVKDIKNEIATPDVNKCRIEVYVFKAKYGIEYSRFRMGTKNFIDYYKPWRPVDPGRGPNHSRASGVGSCVSRTILFSPATITRRSSPGLASRPPRTIW